MSEHENVLWLTMVVSNGMCCLHCIALRNQYCQTSSINTGLLNTISQKIHFGIFIMHSLKSSI